MSSMRNRLALHTWTLDTTPLAETLRIARETSWDAIELRQVDFSRALEAGQSTAQVVELVRASGLKVAAVGVENGWMFAEGDEQRRLLRAFAASCDTAVALGCTVMMSAIGPGRGTVRQAAAAVREVGDLAARRGLRVAIEFNSQGEKINSLESAREVLAAADHPACRLLLDAYHLQRSGRGGRGFEEVAPDEILYFQYSDVPASGLRPGFALDRLPPGRGVIDFPAVFGLLAEKGYAGYLSYEAPNPAAWARDPVEVAREAAEATRALLPG